MLKLKYDRLSLHEGKKIEIWIINKPRIKILRFLSQFSQNRRLLSAITNYHCATAHLNESQSTKCHFSLFLMFHLVHNNQKHNQNIVYYSNDKSNFDKWINHKIFTNNSKNIWFWLKHYIKIWKSINRSLHRLLIA